MKRGSTLFLRAAIIVMGLGVVAFCIFAIPNMSKSIGDEFPMLAYLHYPVMIGMYAAAIPFFIILYQGLKLLQHIDKNTAFSGASLRALNAIKRSAIAIGIIYWASVPAMFYPIAQIEDAPGIIVGGILIASAPFVFAVFVQVLKRLLENAIAFKSENDLTV